MGSSRYDRSYENSRRVELRLVRRMCFLGLDMWNEFLCFILIVRVFLDNFVMRVSFLFVKEG